MNSHRLSSSTADDFIVPVQGETFAADDGTVSQVMDSVDATDEEVRQYAETNMGMNLPEDNRYLYLARELLTHPLPVEWKPCRTNDEVYYFNFRSGESSWDHPLHEEYMDRLEDERERAAQQLRQPKPTLSINSTSTPAAAGGPAALASASGTPRRMQSEAEKQLEERIRTEIKTKYETQATQVATLHASKLASLRNLHEQDMSEARAADEKRREALAATVDTLKRTRLQAVRERCDNEYRTQLTDLGLQVQSLTKQLNQLNGEAERARNSKEKTEAERVAKEDLARAMRGLTGEVNAYKSAQQREKDAAFSRAKRAVEGETQQAVEAARASFEAASVQDVHAAQEAEETARTALEARTAELTAALTKTKAAVDAATTAAASSASPHVGVAESKAPTASATETAALSAAKSALAATQAEHKAGEEAFRKEQEQVLATLRQQLRTTSSQLSTPQHSTLAANASFDNNSPTASKVGSDRDGPVKATVQVAALPSTPRLPVMGPTAGASAFAADEPRRKLESRYAELKQRELATLAAKRRAALAAVAPPASAPTATAAPAAAVASPATNWNLAPSVVALKEAHAEEQAALSARYTAMEQRLTEQLAKELSDESYETKTAFNKEVQQEVMAFELSLYVDQAEARRQRMQSEFDIKRDKALADHEIALAAHERHKAQNAARQASEKEDMRSSMLDDLIKTRLDKEREKFMSASSASLRRRQSQYLEEELAIKQEVDEEMQAYERAEQKKIEQAAQAQAAQQKAALEKQQQQQQQQAQQAQEQQEQQERQVQAQQDDAQMREFNEKKRAVTEAVATATKDLATLRDTAQADAATQKAALRTLSEKLLAVEQSTAAANKAKAAVVTAAAAASDAKPAVVTRRVQPPNSQLRTLHTARLTALEEGYQAQTKEATEAVDQWRARRLALPAPSTVLATTTSTTSGGGVGAVPRTSSAGVVPSTSTYVPVEGPLRTHAAGSLSPTAYMAEQQEHIRRRQQTLLSARAQYQQEQQHQQLEQQQQQQQMQQQQQLLTAPSYTGYSRSRSAGAPSLLWQSDAPQLSMQPSLYRASPSPAAQTSVDADGSVLLTSQLAAAVRHLNTRLDQLSTHVSDTRPHSTARAASSHARLREASPRQSRAAADRSGLRRSDVRDGGGGGGHSSYRAQRRTASSSPHATATRDLEDVSRKWNSLLLNEGE